MSGQLLIIAGGYTPTGSVGTTGDNPFLEFDSTVELNTQFKGSVSSHPVESGTRVTDHFTRENPAFTMRGVTSNAPVLLSEGNSVSSSGKRTQNMYDILKGMYKRGELFTLVSDLDSYGNCVIKNFGFTQNAQQAEALYVDLDIEQLRVVSSRRVVALVPVDPNKAPDSVPTENKGIGNSAESDFKFLPTLKGEL